MDHVGLNYTEEEPAFYSKLLVGNKGLNILVNCLNIIYFSRKDIIFHIHIPVIFAFIFPKGNVQTKK
jgi:hypothetical protein